MHWTILAFPSQSRYLVRAQYRRLEIRLQVMRPWVPTGVLGLPIRMPRFRTARKSRFAEANWQVVLTRGVPAVSMRRVAEQAGVVVSSLRYIFPTRAELMTFSAELLVRRMRERVHVAQSIGDPSCYILKVVKEVLPISSSAHTELKSFMGLMAEAKRVPRIGAVRDDAHRELGEISLRMVEGATGLPRWSDQVDRASTRLDVLVSGLVLHLTPLPPEENCAWAVDVVLRELDVARDKAGWSAGDVL